MQSEKELLQNLEDAGCPKASIDAFLDCRKSGDFGKGDRILEHCRKELLDQVHEGERKISCLDYLRYRMDRCERK